MIKFQSVHKWFKQLHVLNDINLHVVPGEVLVVCGPSGSGKSTLIRTIKQLEPIDQGNLVVDGMDLADKKLTHVATQINNRTLAFPTEIFLFIAVVYFILCFAFTSLSRLLEKRLVWR